MEGAGMILAVDPGDTTGYAVLHMDGRCRLWGHKSAEDFITWLGTAPLDTVEHIVIEDFVLFARKAKKQTGSRFKTVQVIGALKMRAGQLGIPFHMQGSDIKPIAERWSKVFPPADHSKSHKYDAFNHGFYWLVKHGYAPTAWERERG